MPTDQALELPSPEGPRTEQVPTVKRCPPFLEAMTCGYLVPLPGEVTFTRQASGGLEFRAMGKIVDTQHPLQVRGSPMQGALIVKFINPWVIKTPPGYSTLFLPPLNSFELPFQVLSGLVETDTYYRPVHFPTLCLLRPGQTVTLKRGTPIAQVIPMKREDWTSQAVAWDAAARQEIEQTMLENRQDFYKDRHWKKKSYG
jgi:antitoxin (DNA-binding transcriptional repressor) of toxin-antitoxin stability system